MLAGLLAVSFIGGTSLAAMQGRLRPAGHKALPPLKTLDRFTMKDGRQVTVVAGDFALIVDPKHGTRTVRYLPELAAATHGMIVPDRSLELTAINKPARPVHPYVDGEVLIVLRPGTRFRSDRLALSATERKALRRAPGAKHVAALAAYEYSNDAALNSALTLLGVSYAKRLLASVNSSRLAAMRSRALDPAALIPLENTYLAQITNGTVPAAIARLRREPAVLYAGPNLRVSTMNTQPVPFTKTQLDRAMQLARSGHDTTAAGAAKRFDISNNDIPTNYAVAYSAQSALNAPGVNAVAAYDEIDSHFNQLPGTGEIITNVSVGDIVNTSAALNQNSPCHPYQEVTVTEIGGQNYLQLPSLPLIPAYVADDQGNVSGSGAACGQDPNLTEVGLDFSVMAALPHNLQVNGAIGSGYSDLLGIAPGASYRLVVPQTTAPTLQAVEQGPSSVDLVGALIGATLQTPQPNVINMSIGFGFDQYGFPSRYLEEDPILRSAVASAVAQGIVVCIAGGDGLRTFTNAPVGPSGGTVPIDTIGSVAAGATSIADDEFSTTPSEVIDTGSIAVGGTTLDDVTSAPPYETQFSQYRDQLVFPQTRWNGMGSFASAFGTRVNISAPSDNIVAVNLGGVGSTGGTSAASPMVAAAAAVALQVARLTGKPLTTPRAVRSFLESTARPVPNVPQADVHVAVGPQLNVGNAVETLLRKAGITLKPAVRRVAIAQRYPETGDFIFTSDTDPTAIDLTDMFSAFPYQAGSAAFQPITIAPDWEALPPGTKFRLYLTNKPAKVLGTDPWTRLYPSQILQAANQPFYSTQPRTIGLTYEAYDGLRVVVQSSVSVTFSPNSKNLEGLGEAPTVPAVVTGSTIPVQYDIRSVDPSFVQNPKLIVSYPGRMSPWGAGDPGYKAIYSVPLTAKTGTVEVPVSALGGDGIYGIAVQVNQMNPLNTIGDNAAPVATTYAYTRVATAGSHRPAAPVLAYQGDAQFPIESGHAVDVSYDQPFQVSWSVTNVPNAQGAELEISAAGPSLEGNYNTFDNPNGSVIDDNGVDTGSVYTVALPGTSGTMTVNPWSNLNASEYYTVRVLPMAGAKTVGEAGNVSTVVTHGVLPSDGGLLLSGFDANILGTSGVLTSTKLLDTSNNVDSSLQLFDQTSNLVTSTLVSQSTDATASAATGGGNAVPMYELNGFGMNATDNTAFVSAVNSQWGSFLNQQNITAVGVMSGAQWTGSLLGAPCTGPEFPCANLASQFPNVILGSTWNSSLGSTGSYSGDYLLEFAFQNGGNGFQVMPVTNGVAGTPVALPDPAVTLYQNYALGDCFGFVVYQNEASLLMTANAVLEQSVNLSTGSVSSPVVVANSGGTTCNLGVIDGTLGVAVSGAGDASQLYTMSPGGSARLTSLYGGYIPVAFSAFQGKQLDGWAIVDAIPADYTTNANASSSIEVVSQLGAQFHGVGPVGNYDVLSIPNNNRYLSSGQNGLLYLMGDGGYEVEPFATGL